MVLTHFSSFRGSAVSEKVVGWGISHHLQRKPEPVLRNNKLVLEAERSVHFPGSFVSSGLFEYPVLSSLV